jgi:hypothetical protein
MRRRYPIPIKLRANRIANDRLRLRLICSQIRTSTYRVKRSASRRSVDEGAYPFSENRRWSNQTKGRAVPVIASVDRKKNSQRGPTVGNVVKRRIINPTHPTTAMMMAAMMRLR